MRFHFPLSDQPPADLPGGLVAELYEALKENSFEGGCTARMFLPFFDAAVERHGWTYQGPRRNRNRLIYVMATGAFYRHRNYSQLITPEALDIFPHWRLQILGRLKDPASSELWDRFRDRVVPADCDWIRSYLCIDGDYCSQLEPVSRTALRKSGEQVSEEPSIQYYQANDPVTGKAVDVPKGITPGFQYDIRQPAEAYVRHFMKLGMILPVAEKEDWY